MIKIGIENNITYGWGRGSELGFSRCSLSLSFSNFSFFGSFEGFLRFFTYWHRRRWQQRERGQPRPWTPPPEWRARPPRPSSTRTCRFRRRRRRRRWRDCRCSCSSEWMRTWMSERSWNYSNAPRCDPRYSSSPSVSFCFWFWVSKREKKREGFIIFLLSSSSAREERERCERFGNEREERIYAMHMFVKRKSFGGFYFHRYGQRATITTAILLHLVALNDDVSHISITSFKVSN